LNRYEPNILAGDCESSCRKSGRVSVSPSGGSRARYHNPGRRFYR